VSLSELWGLLVLQLVYGILSHWQKSPSEMPIPFTVIFQMPITNIYIIFICIYIYYNIYMCEHIPKKCSVMELGIFPKHGSDFLGSHCVWIPKVGRLKQFRVMLVIASFLGWVKTHDTLWLCQNSY